MRVAIVEGEMTATYLHDATNVPMSKERRERKRYRMDCPVTVLTPGRGKKRMIGRGWLHDINDKGARFVADNPLQAGDRITLEVHFLNSDGEVTDIRFPGIVKRASGENSYEIAVSFLKGESFIRHEDSRGEGMSRAQISKSGNWIN